MQIPSASALMDAFSRIARFADTRPAHAQVSVERPNTAAQMSQTSERTMTRQAVTQAEAAEDSSGDFRMPPDGFPVRRGMLVDIRV